MNKKNIKSEVEALKMLQNGDEYAFEYLFNRYYKRIYLFVYNTLFEKIYAEDITQFVFVKLWENRFNIDPEQKIENFLFVIARNKVYSQTSKLILLEKYLTEMMHEAGTVNESLEIENRIDNELLSGILNQWIEELPEKRKEIVTLKRKYGLSTQEIAEKLNLSSKTVETQLRRAMIFLRNKVQNLILTLLF